MGIGSLGSAGRAQMSIRTKVSVILVLFGLCSLTLAYRNWSGAHELEVRSAAQLTDRLEPIADLKVISDRYAVNIVDASHKTRNGNFTLSQGAEAIATAQREIPLKWQHFIRGGDTVASDAQRAAIEARMQQADTLVNDLLQAMRSGDRATLDRLVVTRLYATIDPLTDQIAQLSDSLAKQSRADLKGTEDYAFSALIIAGVLAAIALVALAAVGFVLNGSVVRPIRALADQLGRLAQDPQAGAIPYAEKGDEIGAIAQACVAFQTSLEAQSAEQRRNAQELGQFGELMSDHISALAAGDLTRTIDANVPMHFEPLKHDFNSMVAELRTMLGAVRQSADSIRTGAHEIGAASDDLARRTESSAANLQETSTALSEMNERLQSTADAARNSFAGTESAKTAVGEGRAVAGDAVRSMAGVSESARGIDAVIEGLDKIAFQTRVLAMNAAVEAGRAGEAGRGFAVVADLVSALAMRAEEQAKQAREQLTATQADIHSAVSAVERVGTALDAIFDASVQASDLVRQIADESEEQAAAISQITSAIAAMDLTVQQNAAMVEQSSAATRSLLSEVDDLAGSTTRFVVDGSGAAPRARSTGPKSFSPANRLQDFV